MEGLQEWYQVGVEGKKRDWTNGILRWVRQGYGVRLWIEQLLDSVKIERFG